MKTRLIKGNTGNAAEVIRAGGLVAVPTETVYGLAANGLDASAVMKIYEVKGRPERKALSLMVASPSAMEEYCLNVPPQAKTLAEKFWPGPLTVILDAGKNVPEIVRAGGSTVGLRCPDHKLTLELIREAGVPLAAPSANPSGEPSPKNARKVLEYFDGKIDAVLDGGECILGRESTILDMSRTPYSVLRQGALPRSSIVSALRENLTIVGITGGTGCGKTTALKTLECMGALVIDADAVYHELTVSSAEMREEITNRYGEVYDGTALNRKKLGAVVFSDKKALADLNRITHKYVDMAIDEMLRAFAMEGGRVAAIDAIGLLEASFALKTNFNVAVTAPREERIKRIMAREGIDREYAQMRVSAQHSNEYFAEKCDYVLENNSDIATFEDKCNKFFAEVLKNA